MKSITAKTNKTTFKMNFWKVIKKIFLEELISSKLLNKLQSYSKGIELILRTKLLLTKSMTTINTVVPKDSTIISHNFRVKNTVTNIQIRSFSGWYIPVLSPNAENVDLGNWRYSRSKLYHEKGVFNIRSNIHDGDLSLK